ncbi:MAG: RNA polymerase factor sigma-54 [Rhodospirillales bacterium]|nr:RNA polymerase factor sigma-54 [Rhodospirillales bacterium]
MSLAPCLDLRQTQSMVMTPQLQQAVKLLQLSNIELTSYVAEELERNPLLERDSAAETTQPEAEDRNRQALETESEASDRRDDAENVNLDAAGSMPWSTGGPVGRGSNAGGGLNGVESTVARDFSLQEYMAQQIHMELDGTERLIALHLLGTLDQAGYLTADREQTLAQLGYTQEAFEAVLQKLQRLDPPGVFARDLRECLRIQLEDRNRLDPVSGAMLDNLDLVAKRDFNTLRKIGNCSNQDILDVLNELKALDPKPGLRFDAGPIQAIAPDVIVRASQAGGWHVQLNTDSLPRILANECYFAEVQRNARTDEDKAFVTEQWTSANWLLKALDQRARTILRVAQEIVRQQDMFLVKGVEHLKPLVLRDIADALELHESTVSRVTSNKFMLTPRGIFELKYFFTASLGNTDGGPAHSAEAVRHRIKALVEAETAAKVMSDDGIVSALADEGISIARRTVAKYREAMRIPSSVQRRRELRLDRAPKP